MSKSKQNYSKKVMTPEEVQVTMSQVEKAGINQASDFGGEGIGDKGC
jgi:hypothetical protein